MYFYEYERLVERVKFVLVIIGAIALSVASFKLALWLIVKFICKCGA